MFCVGGEGLRDSPAGQMTVAYRVKASFTLRGGESREKLWPDLCFHRTILGVTYRRKGWAQRKGDKRPFHKLEGERKLVAWSLSGSGENLRVGRGGA